MGFPYCRLYSKAKILGYKRGQRVTEHNVSLVKIEGVLTNKDARYYQGKRVAYVYKAKRATKNKVWLYITGAGQ